jgi:hypothetical protein
MLAPSVKTGATTSLRFGKRHRIPSLGRSTGRSKKETRSVNIGVHAGGSMPSGTGSEGRGARSLRSEPRPRQLNIVTCPATTPRSCGASCSSRRRRPVPATREVARSCDRTVGWKLRHRPELGADLTLRQPGPVHLMDREVYPPGRAESRPIPNQDRPSVRDGGGWRPAEVRPAAEPTSSGRSTDWCCTLTCSSASWG